MQILLEQWGQPLIQWFLYPFPDVNWVVPTTTSFLHL